ncbi:MULTISPECIES: hypothetical protein [unclassified Breznakia]|uniref:hypothetical protein n=1 Tax=unclassified Breznakia TaxID=2623764 RepID=UPI00247722A7|nr:MULTISPECIES: hypothetical protein [unclassified Breznakia]MDH6367352.1 hypothetical protein [Breznakia sp. PH1-1]MDH6404500.1 hypothetical protein [Breznakia sp. PF1-11]MDH6412209.1 hypothetical protein [Breznakia sp. PFB1-11]MDH6414519.1 hypothetical protein [Breznakia sp. PFB1-14]MDH6416873.1 hypothetical protein [Breznakia sp. PFB1-4]
MLALIREEAIKLFRKKTLWIIFIVLLGYVSYATYDNYQEVIPKNHYLLNESGEQLTGIEAIRYIDEKRHELAGNVDKVFIQKYNERYDEALRKAGYYNLEEDTERMDQLYTDENKKMLERYIEASKNWNFDDELQKWIGTFEMYIYCTNENESDMTCSFLPLYKQEAEVQTVHAIYDQANTFFPLIKPQTSEKPTDSKTFLDIGLQYMIDKDTHIILKWGDIDGVNYQQFFVPMKPNKEIGQYLDTSPYWQQMNKEYLQTNTYYDSLIGTELYMKDLGEIDSVFGVSLLLFFVLLFGDLFSYDSQTKTDQIIYSSAYGGKQLRFARCITACIFVVMTVLISELLILLISHAIVPIRGLDLAVVMQDGLFNIYQSHLNVQYGTMVLASIGLFIMACIAVSSLTMMFSYLLKNRIVTTIIMFMFIIITFFYVFPLDISLTGMQSFLPSVMLKFEQYFQYNASGSNGTFLPYITVFGHVFGRYQFVIGFWIAISTILCSMITFVNVHKEISH